MIEYSLKDHLIWKPDANRSGFQIRLFAVPPKWLNAFRGDVLAPASAHIWTTGGTYARVVISSKGITQITFEGPMEDTSQAQVRLQNLMTCLSGRYIPSEDELKTIASKCGCRLSF